MNGLSENNAFGARNILIKGLKDVRLSKEQAGMLESRVKTKYDKIKKSAGKIDEFIVHFKAYEKEGPKDKARKYSISVKVVLGKTILSTKASDWGIMTALEKGLENLERKLKKDYRVLASGEEQVS